jgi:hypothetical protein
MPVSTWLAAFSPRLPPDPESGAQAVLRGLKFPPVCLSLILEKAVGNQPSA